MRAKHRVIGLDLDDVLAGFNETLSQYHNKHYGTKYRREDIRSFSLEETWNVTSEVAIQRLWAFLESPELTNTLPISGSVSGVHTLKQHSSLQLVTARPESLKDKTFEWLERYFPKVFNEIHFVNHFGDGKRRGKGEVCKELGVEIFVDDSMANAVDIASVRIPVLLFDTPWNQGSVNEPIKRVHSWEEIVKVLLE